MASNRTFDNPTEQLRGYTRRNTLIRSTEAPSSAGGILDRCRLLEREQSTQTIPGTRRPRCDRLPREESLQVIGQGRRGQIASLGFLCQALEANRFQLAR